MTEKQMQGATKAVREGLAAKVADFDRRIEAVEAEDAAELRRRTRRTEILIRIWQRRGSVPAWLRHRRGGGGR